jgi:hypothetical protein
MLLAPMLDQAIFTVCRINLCLFWPASDRQLVVVGLVIVGLMRESPNADKGLSQAKVLVQYQKSGYTF